MRIFTKPDALVSMAAQTKGFMVADHEGDRYWLVTKDHRRHRYITVRHGQAPASTVFQSWFPVRFPLDKTPQGLFGRVLVRIFNLIYASWCADIGTNCDASLCVVARVPSSALDARLLEEVCGEIHGEIESFAQELRDKFNYGIGEPGAPCRRPAPLRMSPLAAAPMTSPSTSEADMLALSLRTLGISVLLLVA